MLKRQEKRSNWKKKNAPFGLSLSLSHPSSHSCVALSITFWYVSFHPNIIKEKKVCSISEQRVIGGHSKWEKKTASSFAMCEPVRKNHVQPNEWNSLNWWVEMCYISTNSTVVHIYWNYQQGAFEGSKYRIRSRDWRIKYEYRQILLFALEWKHCLFFSLQAEGWWQN